MRFMNAIYGQNYKLYLSTTFSFYFIHCMVEFKNLKNHLLHLLLYTLSLVTYETADTLASEALIVELLSPPPGILKQRTSHNIVKKYMITLTQQCLYFYWFVEFNFRKKNMTKGKNIYFFV